MICERDWEQLAWLATSMGGLEVGGHARCCKAYYASTVLNCWPELQRTSSMLQGISITDASYPMLAECCTAYEAYRTQRNGASRSPLSREKSQRTRAPSS